MQTGYVNLRTIHYSYFQAARNQQPAIHTPNTEIRSPEHAAWTFSLILPGNMNTTTPTTSYQIYNIVPHRSSYEKLNKFQLS